MRSVTQYHTQWLLQADFAKSPNCVVGQFVRGGNVSLTVDLFVAQLEITLYFFIFLVHLEK